MPLISDRELYVIFQLTLMRFPLEPKIILIAEKKLPGFSFDWDWKSTFIALLNRAEQPVFHISKLKYRNLKTLKSAVWSLFALNSCVLQNQSTNMSALLEIVGENGVEDCILDLIKKYHVDPAQLRLFMDENYDVATCHLLLSKSTASSIPKEALVIPGLIGITFLKGCLDFVPSILLLKSNKLKHMNLSGNPLTLLPPFINNFKVLTYLGLEETLLESLPSLPSSLESLSLAGSKRLTTFPAEIANLSHLVALDLSGCSLTSLPDWIGQENTMKAPLHTLKLSGNSIERLPDSLGQLTTLKNLYVSDNKLMALSDFQKLSLTLLDVSNNNLTQIAKPLSKAGSLRVLSLASNNFSLISSAVLAQTSLTYLNVAHNKLISLSPHIGKLTKLVYFDLTHNKLKRIPKTLVTMQELVEINMTGNRLLEAPSLDGIPTLMNVYFDIPAK